MEALNRSPTFSITQVAEVAKSQILAARTFYDQRKQTYHRQPILLGILASEDSSALAYAQWTRKVFEANGCQFRLRHTSVVHLENEIQEANGNDNIDGIIVYYPVHREEPGADRRLQRMVSPEKDVEGLCDHHLHALYENFHQLDPTLDPQVLIPCTPLAVLQILDHIGLRDLQRPWRGRLVQKTITIINRSDVVGKPLAALLAGEGATVFSVDITGTQLLKRSKGSPRYQLTNVPGCHLEDCLPISDVVISGVPDQTFQIPTNLLKENCICVDLSSHQNFDKGTLGLRATSYTSNIGRITVAMLYGNLLKLALRKDKN